MEQKTTGVFGETFSPLRNPNLSIYLSGQTISLFGTMMQTTAQAWVVWQISHSTSALGLVAMLASLPMLVLGAFAGVWADRLDRRKLLIGTQLAALILAVVFAVLLQSGLIQLWHIYILATLLGCVSAVDMPSQTTFIGDLSGVDQVRKSVVLNNMVVQTSRMVGPALAGWVMGSLGVAPAFWINAASFLPVIGSLLAVRANQVRRPAGAAGKGEMGEAFAFIAAHPRIQDLLILCMLMTFFGFAAAQLIPAIVTDVLHAGPSVLGMVSGASGAGALVGALVITPIVQRSRHPGRMAAAGLMWMGLWFCLVILGGSTPLWVTGMFLGSLSSPAVMTTANGLLQMLAPATMRARLLSIWIMASFGIAPFGALLIGFTGHLFGPSTAILINGLIIIGSALALLVMRPGLARWEPEAAQSSQPGMRLAEGD
jgi:MFS family permease